MPDLGRWDPPVPIVLLDGMYMPYTDRTPPISGIGGDVREPRNIIWLCNTDPETYPVSLAEAAVIDLAVRDG